MITSYAHTHTPSVSLATTGPEYQRLSTRPGDMKEGTCVIVIKIYMYMVLNE